MNKFDTWNQVKQSLDQQNIETNKRFPGRREVWFCAVGKNIGREQSGGNNSNFSRPVLVLRKFNNGMVWGIPLSTKQKELDYYFNFIDPHGRPVSAVIAQLRLFSTKRFRRLLYIMNLPTYEAIRAKAVKTLWQ